MNAIESFSERFNQSLREKGWDELKDRELASRFGVSNTTVWNWRNAQKLPSLETAIELADALGVTVEWLLTGKGPRSHQDCLDLSSLSKEQTVHIKALVDTLSQPVTPGRNGTTG